MIGRLRGTVISKSPTRAMVDVNGVGYLVDIPLSTYEALPALEKETTLQIHTQVREDAFQLFGFHSDQERQIFEVMISVSGVGGKLALAALSALSPSTLIAAISQDDITTLSRIPGVGKKTAQRLIVELKDKMAKLSMVTTAQSKPVGQAPTDLLLREELLSALLNLGYKQPQAESAIHKAPLKGITSIEKALPILLKALMS